MSEKEVCGRRRGRSDAGRRRSGVRRYARRHGTRGEDAGKDIFQANVKVESTFRFSPGTIRVPSGGTITFQDTSSNDPHTITISPKAALPKSQDAPCKACQIAAGHLKDPNDPSKGVKAYVLNKGPAGLDELGDSLAIVPHGPHKTASIVVSAPAGTTLYFVCAVHPWMQGKIIVK